MRRMMKSMENISWSVSSGSLSSIRGMKAHGYKEQLKHLKPQIPAGGLSGINAHSSRQEH